MGRRFALKRIALGAALAIAAACGRDPRGALAELRVDYSAQAFVVQAGEGDAAAVRWFLAAGMSPDSRGAGGATPLIAAAEGRHGAVVRALVAARANLNLTNDDGVTALSAAAWNGDTDTVRALLDAGADVSAERPVPPLPLMRAIRAGHDAVVTLLLDKGAHPYVQDDQWSALMLAAFLGRDHAAGALIARGADVNAKNDRGITSLMHAASRGHARMVQTLLDRGAEVDAFDAGGHTALMFAANNGQVDAVRTLLAHKADVSRQNRAGSTALSLATANGHAGVVELLQGGATSAQLPPVSSPGVVAPVGGSDVDLQHLMRQALTFPDERRLFAEAAATAWRYADRHYRRGTGLIDPTSGYAFATVWDIASGIAALYSAHELALLDEADYDTRMRTALGTLQTMVLFDGAAFNKIYSTKTGSMIAGEHPTSRGFGWSALDIGRLLVWLKIVAVNQPKYRDAAAAVVQRLAMDRIVSHGYLYGEDLDGTRSLRRYQEGRIGYEQYAARGFALWGAAPVRALRLHENSLPITVMGLPLPGDVRGRDRIASDPIVLMGLELGWDRDFEQFAWQFLQVQDARYRQTGLVTLSGEDAINRPPYFFYYYCAFANGKAFGVDVQDLRAVVDQPRWVSAKAAFAWHVLRPSAYTERALQTVAAARMPEGWGSGVYEGSGAPTGTANINTAAAILTAALVHVRGGPLLR